MMSAKQLWMIIVVLLMLSVVGCGVIVTPDAPPTPTPFVMQSLFVEDTCAPPCWFGLTPGVSRAENVVNLAEGLDDIGYFQIYSGGTLDNETGYLVEGQYRFTLGPWGREDDDIGESIFYISDGIVSAIYVVMNTSTSLEQAVRVLGRPDHIRFGGGNALLYLDLIYFDPPLRIELHSSTSRSLYRPDICDEESIGEAFWLDYIFYFAPIEEGALPRKLIEVYSFYDREIPLELWHEWSANNWAINCSSALSSLQYLDLPYLPTLTPSHLPTVMPSLLITPTATP